MKKKLLKYTHLSKRYNILKFEPDNRNHYVYRITNLRTNEHYYGSRVTKLEPKDDLGIKYFSSSSDKEFLKEQKENPKNFKYKVIKIFDNPGDSILYESYLHQYFQVSSNDKFINKSNQTPFGWTNTNNKHIAEKISKHANTITENGLTNAQIAGKKISISRNTPDINGITPAQRGGKKSKVTKNTITENGLTNAQIAGKKISISRNTPDINGITPAQYGNMKFVKTMSKLDKNGISKYSHNGKKISISLNLLEENGKSVAKNAAKKISGINSRVFKGYFIFKNVKYCTSKKLGDKLGVSVSSICRWCKNNNKIITLRSYNNSKYLQSLGTSSEIIGLTFQKLGFNFLKIE